jgi:two-component system NtrC family sensor kinase
MPAALQIMKKKGLDLPFIVVSGAIGEESAVEAMRSGANDYVMKDKLARLAPAVERELREAEVRRERHRMEEALRNSEEKFRRFVEEMNDGYCVVQDSKVVFANTRSAEMFGYLQEEVVGKAISELLPLEIVQKLVEMHEKRKRGESVPPQYEIELTRKDGNACWVEFGARLIEYGGKPAASVVIRDITQRRLMEEEKKRMEQQLHFAGRLAAVGELAAGVAHELNNPLAAVLLYSQFLQSREDLDETMRSDVETVHMEAQRATRITSSLLSFARRHRPEKSLISIKEAIEKSVELNAGRLRMDHVDVALELEQDLPNTMADFHQMQQVFVNIINNADQAMLEARGGGKLHIKSQKIGEMIQIAFADDGPGISEENVKRIFDPFFTTKDVGKGTGLGLSICYGIVEEHGGRMSVKSSPGQGATFTVEIPIETEMYDTDENDII